MSTKKKSRIHIDGDKLVLIAAIIVVFALFTCLNRVLNFLVVERVNEGCCHAVLWKCVR